MEIMTLKSKELNKKLQKVINEYYKKADKNLKHAINLMFIRGKTFSIGEYFLYFIVIYQLNRFDIITDNDPILTDKDKNNLKIFGELLKCEMNGDAKKYINILLTAEKNVFLLKIIIKYSLLFNLKLYTPLIPDLDKYIKTIGWLIPLTSYLEYPQMLSFFQDAYFKHCYPKEYNETKVLYIKKTKKINVIGNFMVDIINDIYEIMRNKNIMGMVKIRRKSLFSLYNKMLRKKENINDIVGVRIIVKNMIELKYFTNIFEKRFHINRKKDYIKNPKNNGYQSIHYSFIHTYDNYHIKIELQIRTLKMDKEINDDKELKHFAYTILEKKIDPLFVEVNEALRHLLNYIKKRKIM